MLFDVWESCGEGTTITVRAHETRPDKHLVRTNLRTYCQNAHQKPCPDWGDCLPCKQDVAGSNPAPGITQALVTGWGFG
jgi:hypothetical protein